MQDLFQRKNKKGCDSTAATRAAVFSHDLYKMLVPAIKCNKCGYIVFSRCRHDMRWCECESCAIDGGFSGYIKISGEPSSYTLIKDYDVGKLTEIKLYRDWNSGKDKYGKIKPK